MISYFVTILSDSRLFLGSKPLKDESRKRERIRERTIIGKDAWVGTKAIILPGVKIGNHAIVGAGSVVTKNIEDWDIVGGNPARKIMNRLDSIPNKKN